jgi:SAM-dependent methyltransferase
LGTGGVGHSNSTRRFPAGYAVKVSRKLAGITRSVFNSIRNPPRMQRTLEPEFLDDLPANDPRAIASRRDLRRVNVLMNTAGIVARALNGTFTAQSPRSIVELGAGDGTSLLRLAEIIPPRPTPIRAALVDRQQLLTAETKQAFAARNWNVESVAMDAFDWLDRPAPESSDVIVTSLFLHHFLEPDLRRLLSRASQQTNAFLACEPKRANFPFIAASLLGFIGCNSVTRHDAKVSVRAGFAEKELSALWPNDKNWKLTERPGGLFSHCFVAQRIQQRDAHAS